MVIQGRPTINLLPAAGGRVADVGLALTGQALQARQQNIQASLGRLQAQIQQDRLAEEGRRFDISTQLQQERVAMEQQLALRDLDIRRGRERRQQELQEQNIRLAQQSFALGASQFEQELGLKQDRLSFDEERQEFVQENTLARQRQGDLSLANKRQQEAFGLLRDFLITFDPDGKTGDRFQVPAGVENLVNNLLDQARELGVDVSLSDILQTTLPAANQQRQVIQQQALDRLQRRRLVGAQTSNLEAAAQSKLREPIDKSIPQRIKGFDTIIKSERDRIFDIEDRIIQIDDLIQDQTDLRVKAIGKGTDEKPESPTGVSNADRRIQSLNSQREQQLDSIKRSQQRIGINENRRESLFGGAAQQAPGAFGGQQLQGQTRGTIPLSRDISIINDMDAIIERQANFIEGTERGIAASRASLEKGQETPRVKIQENIPLSNLIIKQQFDIDQRQERDQQKVQRIANMEFPEAFAQTVALERGVADLSQIISQKQVFLDTKGQGLSTTAKASVEQFISANSRVLDQTRRTILQLRNKIDEFRGQKDDLARLGTIANRLKLDPRRPASRGFLASLSRRVEVPLSRFFGQNEQPFGPESEAEQIRNGRDILSEMKTGQLYDQADKISKEIRQGSTVAIKSFFAQDSARSADQLRFMDTVPDSLKGEMVKVFTAMFDGNTPFDQETIKNDLARAIRSKIDAGSFPHHILPAAALAMQAFGFDMDDVEETLKPFDMFSLITNFKRGRKEGAVPPRGE